MASSTPVSLDLVVARVRADLSSRWHHGEAARVEEYLTLFPELQSDDRRVIDLIEVEFLLCLQTGSGPILDDYLRRFPRYRDELLCRLGQLSPPARSHSQSDLARTVPEPPSAAPPTLLSLPGYEILGEIGRGGMGIVYKARQIDLDRIVAIKLINTGSEATTQERERFRNEAAAVARLHHPGVVQIHHFGEHQGQSYFAMEHLPGGTLSGRLRRGRIDPEVTATLVEQLARAVGAAHEASVLHRDLKPGNVLFAADGSPRITDFGLARLLDREDGQPADLLVGTPAYMAPEQVAGGQAVGSSADVHALGVILYECLTAKQPYRGRTKGEVLYNVRFTLPEPPSRLVSGIPRKLEAICLKCLHKDPALRHGSAAELAADLASWTRSQREPTSWWRNPHSRGRLVAAALLGVLLVGGLAGMMSQDDRPSQPRRAAEELEAELSQNNPVKILSDAGTARWYRWAAGAFSGRVGKADDGAFCVSCPTFGMLELVRDPRRERYRFWGQIRHDAGFDGTVGFYIAHQQATTPAGKSHFLVELRYNDLENAAEARMQVERLNGEPLEPNLPLNALYLVPQIFNGDDWKMGVRHSFSGTSAEVFTAAGLKGGVWRTVGVEVTPKEVRVLCEQNGKITTVTRWAVKPHLEAIRRRLIGKRTEPGGAAWKFNPEFAPRGGLGLVVTQGVASFRNLVLEPLP